METAPIFGSPLVTDAARRIVAIVAALTRENAEERFLEFLDAATESDEHFDAAFLAAQMLRDLDELDPEEAVFVFAQLLLRRTDTFEEPDAEAVEYYRAHGEGQLAQVIVEAPATYRAVLQNAQETLVTMKPTEEEEPRGDDAPASIAAVSERVLTLSASPPGPEREAAWGGLMEAMNEVSVEARVSAVRRLREVRALTAAEHAALIDHVIQTRFVPFTGIDREMRRRFRSKGIGARDIPSPFRRPEREVRLPARTWRLEVACLRQVGEHELANLYLNDPEAYQALVDEGDASMPIAAHPERHAIDEEAKAAGEASDDELDMVADYWGNLMSASEGAAFEKRISADQAFFWRICPVMNQWEGGGPPAASLRKRLALRRAARIIDGSGFGDRRGRKGKQIPKPRRRKRIAPDGAEVRLVERYIDDKLSAAESAVFEARLIVDKAFYRRVAPYVRVWLRGHGQSPPAKRLRSVRPDLYAKVMGFGFGRGDLPDDAELVLLTDYMVKALTDEEMVAFDNRLSDDEAFFSRMAPMLFVWFQRPLPALIETAEEMRQQSSKRVRRASAGNPKRA